MPEPVNPSTPSFSPPEAAPQSAETASPAPEAVHEQPDIHKTDLSEFNRDFLEKQQKREEDINRFAEFDKDTNTLPPDQKIAALRRGAIEPTEDEKDTLEKHARLASAFLEKTDEKDKISYTVNFGENRLADRYVGAGDILPANVEAIKVTDDNGNVVTERAIRGINNRNRIGYYDAATGAYIAIHTGHRITVLATRTDTSRKLAQENEASFRADPALARRKLGEHISLFSEKANTDPEDLQVGLSKTPPASATTEEIQKHKLPEPAPKTSPAVQKKTTVSELTRQGYSRKGFKVTPKVTQEAVRCLKKGGDIGTTHFMEIDDKKYAFRIEMHKHPPNHCPPLPARLCDNHHGISVFAA